MYMNESEAVNMVATKVSASLLRHSTGAGRLAIAPMMDCTDRHYRFMVRHLTRKTLLYTEMVVDTTLLHQKDHLDYFLGQSSVEDPVVLQLGGSDPENMAEVARMCDQYGNFHEINLNVGCPSPKVSGYNFGARLMLQPELVRDITHQMIRSTATRTPITVKCRIGVDDVDSYEDLVKFVDTVASGGVSHFIVHARKCLLEGLSPKENRFTLNGGIQSLEQGQGILHENNKLLGVMIGRAAYSNPWMLRKADKLFYGAENPNYSRREIIDRYLDYAEGMQAKWGYKGSYSMATTIMMKPLLALFTGEHGARAFKRHISNAWCKNKDFYDIREMVENALEASEIPSGVLHQKPDDLDGLPERFHTCFIQPSSSTNTSVSSTLTAQNG